MSTETAESPAPYSEEAAPSAARSKRSAVWSAVRGFRPSPQAVIAAVIVGLLLVVAGWAGFAYWQLARAGAQYDDGNYAAAESSARTFLFVSPFEKHKGHFAIGTALAADDELDAAEEELLVALDLSPAPDECAVRVNLARVQEAQADTFREAEAINEANERYDAAQETLATAPEECRPDGSRQDGEMTEQEEGAASQQEEMNNPSSGGDDGGAPGNDQGDGQGDGGASGGGGSTNDGGGSSGGSSSDSGGGGDEEASGDRDPRMDELDERRRASEERHSQSNSGSSGSGVRAPGAKPW